MTRVKVGVTDKEVEIGQYRAMDKGSLKGFFSLVIYPEGQKILDCRYFAQGEKKWWSFPQKEIKYTDGRKTEYIPIVSYLNKEYLEQLKIAVLTALKDVNPQENHGQASVQTNTGKKNPLSTEPSFDWGSSPF